MRGAYDSFLAVTSPTSLRLGPQAKLQGCGERQVSAVFILEISMQGPLEVDFVIAMGKALAWEPGDLGSKS